mgnify:FL=1
MDRLESYEKFFRLQRRDQEKKYEQYANTSLNNLFAEGRAYYGTITGTTEHGQLVLRFDTQVTPRLKVPMTFCLIKKKAYEEYDSDYIGKNVTRFYGKSQNPVKYINM